MIRKLVILLCLSCVYTEKAPLYLLNNGFKMPFVGLGTGRTGNETYRVVRDAIEVGYRHIDTSLIYGSEPEIGRALKDLFKEGKVKREELFIVSKLDTSHERSKVPYGIHQSLTNLGLEYLDLYLIHTPQSSPSVDIVETWKGMEDVHKLGLTKSIGVSNFNEEQIDRILANSTVKPVTNQVQCNPYNNQKKLLSYLNSKNISLTAYSPVGGLKGYENLLKDKKLVEIGEKHNVSSAQIALRYQIQRNVIVVAKTVNKKYLIENIDLFNFNLTDSEMHEIDSLDKYNNLTPEAFEKAPRLLLNDGHKMPIVGLGVLRTFNDTYQAVRDAIDAGYRHIDTSLHYYTEPEIGRALKDVFKEGKVKREELFIVSKLENTYHERSKVPQGINESLTNLGLEYLDLYLIHTPLSSPNVDILETWKGMEDIHKLGLTKSIGVSNFNEQQIDRILANSTVKPVTNQVQCNPYNNQKKLLSYLNSKNITLTAYSPLAKNDSAVLLHDEKLVDIGLNHNVTSAQIALRYQIQRNVIVIPKSVSKKHITENIDLFNFKLTDTEMREIDALDRA